MKMKSTPQNFVFNIVGYSYITIISIFCLLPFWLIIAASFTSEKAIMNDGYNMWPTEFSLTAYKTVLAGGDILSKAYLVSICTAVIGTLLGLFMMAMAAYALQRKDMRYRNQISFYVFFTTLFGGGLVPYYILVAKYLGMKNSYLAILLPGLMSPWLLLLLRNFIQQIPDSITESAKIDGAGDFTIFTKLILPLAKPGLATIGLFLALQYWNDWFNASLFLLKKNMFPLQYYLQNVIQNAQYAKDLAARGAKIDLNTPTESLKMATAVVATGPIIFLYPFVQKYFVKGLTVGSVKG
jgi:putative aldouronate transport system permease protein